MGEPTVDEVTAALGGTVIVTLVAGSTGTCTACGHPSIWWVEGTDLHLHDRCVETYTLRASIPAPGRRVGAYGRRAK